jgi:hypothetical protein
MKSIVLFSGFLCFCKETLGKKAASRTPFAKGVLENLPKGEGAFALLRRECFAPTKIYRTTRP